MRATRLLRSMEPLGVVLGFRRAYAVENLLTTVALAAFTATFILYPLNRPLQFAVGILFLTPLLSQVARHVHLRALLREKRAQLPKLSLPVYTVMSSAVASALNPYLLPVALINAFFIEDVSVFFEHVDIVKVKRNVVVIIEPIRRRELVVVLIAVFAATAVSYALTGNILVFVYPVIAYMMVIYSVIIVPPEYRAEIEERKPGVFEEVARRIPYLYFLASLTYANPKVVRIAKEAGYIGASYYEFVRRAAGVFAFTVYTSLAVSPLAFALLEPLGLGHLALLIPLVAGAISFYAPLLVIRMKRQSRAGKISRNLILILSYFASTYSVAESFTNAMEYLRFTPQLSKMFGMENEAKVYLNLFRVLGNEETAMDEYASTIPEDYYRDAVRTIRDLVSNEGYGVTFRALVAKLLEHTTRYIDRVRTLFENIGGNVISVLMLAQTAIPILLFLSEPRLMPVLMIVAGVLSAVVGIAVAMMAFPDLPSEYIYAKPRMKRAAVVFAASATLLTVIEYAVLPELISYLIPLNALPSMALALYYAYREDLEVNRALMEKFPDLITLFSSAMSRYNAVDKALFDLASQSGVPDTLRRLLRRLAGTFSVISAERISYKGPFWYKYFIFLVSLSARYGTTPRDLYKAIAEFMLEFKKFYAHVKSFGASLMFLVLIALIVMTLEVQVATVFLEGVGGVAGRGPGVEIALPFPILSPEEIESMKALGAAGLLIVAFCNGLAVGKASSGTLRDGKYAFILYLVELALLAVAFRTGFGLVFPGGG